MPSLLSKLRSTAFRRQFGQPRRDLKILQYRLQGLHGQTPNAIIIGAQKAGTTTLFDMLGQHPDVVLANFKEVHYFDVNYAKGMAWYKRNFPPQEGKVVLEASPYYLAHPAVPQRIYDNLPDCKIIVILRHPALRAYSHFKHEQRRGFETAASFQEAMALEAKRIEGAEAGLESGSIDKHFGHQHYSYLTRGLYFKQICRWLGLFPKKQMFFTSLEELIASPGPTMEKLSSFLGLSEFSYTLEASNPGGGKADLEEDVRERLRAYYQHDTNQLIEHFGIGHGWW